MSFSIEEHVGYVSYSAVLRHVATEREFTISVGPSVGMPASSTAEELATRETENDWLFQNVMAELVSLGSLEVISAGKFGNFTANLNL